MQERGTPPLPPPHHNHHTTTNTPWYTTLHHDSHNNTEWLHRVVSPTQPCCLVHNHTVCCVRHWEIHTSVCLFVCLYTNVHKSYSRAHVRVSLGMCVFERNCIYIYTNILTQHTYSGYALIMYVCVCLCVWVDTNKRTLILCTETYTRTYVNNWVY